MCLEPGNIIPGIRAHFRRLPPQASTFRKEGKRGPVTSLLEMAHKKSNKSRTSPRHSRPKIIPKIFTMAGRKVQSGFIRWVILALRWISRVYSQSVLNQAFGLYEPLLLKMDTILHSRGQDALILWVKDVRASVLNYLSGNPIRPPGVKCTNDGIPVVLGDLVSELRQAIVPGHHHVLPFLMTILFSTRALNAGKNPDLSTISSPPSVEVPDISRWVVSFWRALRYRRSYKSVPRGIRWTKFHMSTKSGPNGHALWTSLRDFYSLPNPLVEDLVAMGGVEFGEKVSALKRGRKYLERLLQCEPGRFRKLSWFPDRELKVRVIGQLDYFSQTVLRSVHLWLYRVLKKIPQDCTFSQGSFKDRVRGSEVFYSVDLSAATDRFPISVISLVLKGMLPTAYVDCWVRVMSGYPFDYNQKGKWKSISYSVGNPMGAYSSWASFALAHHYVVFYCCMETGVDWHSLKYALLGDDIVIGDRTVGEKYVQVIRSLGVEVSEAKTHISSNFYEFAKRLVLNDQEISPFPFSALREQGSRYYLLVNLLMECGMKGWVSQLGIPRVILEYYETVRPLRRKLRRGIELKSSICEQITYVIRGSLKAGDGLNTVSGLLGHPTSFNDTEGHQFFSRIVYELFTESDPYHKKGDPLGELALSLVTVLSGLEDTQDPGLGFELIYSLPLLGVWGQIEENYLELKGEAAKFDVSDPKWDLTVSSMLVPISDEVFTMRRKHQTMLASTVLGKRVTKSLSTTLKAKPIIT